MAKKDILKYYMNDINFPVEDCNIEIVRKNDINESLILDSEANNSECIICFEGKGGPLVTCVLCSNYSHYRCYKKFIKKSINYEMKCVHCGTKSLRFQKKWWQMWCCLS